MNKNKRCGNCAYYPFCIETNGTSDYCKNWIKRDVQMHLKNKKGEVFDFERIE